MKKVLTSLTLFTAVSSFGLAMNANAEANTTSEIDLNKIEIVSTILPDKTQGETKIIAALDEIDNDKANNIDTPTDTPVEKKTEKKAEDRKSTRLNSSHVSISYAVFCLKKKTHYLTHDQTDHAV